MAFVVVAIVMRPCGGKSYWLAGGIFYAGLSGVFANCIAGSSEAGLIGILFIFAIVWATDILAYFVGPCHRRAEARAAPSRPARPVGAIAAPVQVSSLAVSSLWRQVST